jgi:hypothetical protein
MNDGLPVEPNDSEGELGPDATVSDRLTAQDKRRLEKKRKPNAS